MTLPSFPQMTMPPLVDTNFEVRRIPFTIRLRRLSVDQCIGLLVTDSEELLIDHSPIFQPIRGGYPAQPVSTPFLGPRPRNLYVLHNSPIFILARNIAEYYIRPNEDGFPVPQHMPPNTDDTILDKMIDDYEDYCLKSLNASAMTSISTGYQHILAQSGITIFPSMVCRDLLKCAMVGVIRGGDIIECVEYDGASTRISAPSKSTLQSSAKAMDAPFLSQLDLYRQKVRRQRTIFSGMREAFAFTTIFRNLVANHRHYPLDMKVIHLYHVPKPIPAPMSISLLNPGWTPPITTESSTDSGSKRKRATVVQPPSSEINRRKTVCRSKPSSAASTLGNNLSEAITIDSDDDMQVDDKEVKTAINVDEIETISVNMKSSSEKISTLDNVTHENKSPPPPPPPIIHHPYSRFPDPLPKFSCNSFVYVRSMKIPGYIMNVRIVREAHTIMTLLRPHIIYAVYVKFGFAYVSETDLVPIHDSDFIKNKVDVLLDGVIVTPSDQLRLWPSIYLNDSLINFYLKWLQKEYPSNDIFIFPTYFYSRMSNLESGGTVYKDNHEQRGKLWNDLKGWTKGIDIFQKSLILVPINYSKHWSFVMLHNPGQFLRMPMNKFSKSKKVVEVCVMDDDDKEEAIVKSNDSTNVTVLMNLKERTNGVDGSERSVGELAIHVPIDECVDGNTTGISAIATEKIIDVSEYVDVDLSMDSESQTDPWALADLTPYLIHFDSGKRFKSHSVAEIFRNIRKYIHACYEVTKANQYPGRSVDAKTLPGIHPDLPQQGNAEDCGVYMLEFIERILMKPSSIDNPSISNMAKTNGKIPSNFWFSHEVAAQKRESILALINTLERTKKEIEIRNC